MLATLRRQRRGLVILLVLLAVTVVLAVLTGRYPSPGLISPAQLLKDPLAQSLVLNLRLPRIIAALLLGSGLAAAGLVFQMIFANPLVEPGFLGVSQGAAFGASVSIVAFAPALWIIQLSSALFALIGLAVSYIMARHFHFGGWVLRLILAGIAVSALFSSGIGIVKFVADPMSQLPEITFWMLGGLWSVDWQQTRSILPVCIIGITLLLGYRWRLNLLSMDDRTAFSLGLAPFRERLLLLVTATAVTAATISISGIVAWVGLIVPHIARRLFSSDGRYALPASMIIGAIYVVVCDTLARTVLDGEIPLGVLTSFIGAGLFLVLLSKKRIKKGKYRGESTP
ncbi:MAG: iron ABC transporter permease [Spirochaetaceae bacterium]|nr:iron ABC transporter permease [Spirochaetaceae bacterium]MCF7947310.1 iron ABC transporter permease [Spirochaetia bacterium]MCF7952303.1 iron ABC transporter permease [Spirochaetaceae bacterium]